MTMRSNTGRIVIALLTVCAVVCTACSSSGAPATGTAAAPRTSVIDPDKVIPFDPADNVRSEVAITTCAPVAGTWTATGTVTNRAATRTFQLVVDFTSVPGSTVLSTTVVTIANVRPHQTVRWSASGARGHTHVACLLREAQATG